MRINTIRRGLTSAMALSGLLISTGAYAQKKEVTFAHQDMVVPLRVLMESGELEKQTGYKVNWRMFGGGGDVIKAMASGDVQMGEAGSSPVTAAVSQGQDIKLFGSCWISQMRNLSLPVTARASIASRT